MLSILLVCFNVYAVDSCYKSYSQAVVKVEKICKKAQYRRAAANENYVYEFIPTMMFPLFCVKADTLKKLLPYGTIYLCNSTTIGLNLDKNNDKHIQIAVLQYVKNYRKPAIKTYTMYFFKLDKFINEWTEERAPVVVNLYLKNSEGEYMSK